MNSQKTKDNVVKFLRDLATKLENDELHEEVALQTTEFFMKLNFLESCERSARDSEGDDEDVMKFLSLGWYIYTHLIPRQSSESSPRSYPASLDPLETLD